MKKGDLVIAEQPESTARRLARSYGIVQKITKEGIVIIKMANGSIIERQFNSIAVYIQPPSNWQELYHQQVSFFQPKRPIMFPGSKTKKSRH